MRKDYDMNVNEAISTLPKMQTGLDVNVKFKGYFFLLNDKNLRLYRIKDFEYTSECVIFDLLDIDLVHGWLVDPEDKETYSVLSKISYNQMMEQLVKYEDLKLRKQKQNQVKEDEKNTNEESTNNQKGEISSTSNLDEDTLFQEGFFKNSFSSNISKVLLLKIFSVKQLAN